MYYELELISFVSKRVNSDNPLKILFLAHFYPPEMGGAAARLSGLARCMVNFGHAVTVVTGIPNYPSGRIYKGYRKRFVHKERLDGVPIFRTWVYFTPLKSSFHRIMNYISFMIFSIIVGIKLKKQFDVVIVSSPPLFIGLSGLFLSKVWHIPWIFDIRDIWPDIAVEAGEFKVNDPIVKIGRMITKLIYNTADHLTPVTISKCEKIIGQGIDKNKITMISNGIDMNFINSSTSINWRMDLDLENKCIFVYAGLIGIAQGLDIIIDVANQLRESEQIHFLIVGDGIQKNHLVDRTKQMELSNITFLGSQKRDNISSLLIMADAAIIPLANPAITDAIPSKLMEAWGCKKPVILVASGESNRLVNKISGGLTVEPGDLPGLLVAVKYFYRNASRIQHYGTNGYAYITKSFTREILARQMINLIDNICSARID